jgi:hypothetical protein
MRFILRPCYLFEIPAQHSKSPLSVFRFHIRLCFHIKIFCCGSMTFMSNSIRGSQLKRSSALVENTAVEQKQYCPRRVLSTSGRVLYTAYPACLCMLVLFYLPAVLVCIALFCLKFTLSQLTHQPDDTGVAVDAYSTKYHIKYNTYYLHISHTSISRLSNI